jgi:PhnB protein
VTIHLVVPDVDAAVARAVAAGARAKIPVQDMFRGDRYGTIQHPFGHNGSIATPLRTTLLTAEELAEAAKRTMATHTTGE